MYFHLIFFYEYACTNIIIFLPRACYVKHQKGLHNKQKQANNSNLPHRPADSNCVVCNKGYKSSSGQMRHMVLHRGVVWYADPTNPIKDTVYLYYICLLPKKSNSDLKNHLTGHGTMKGDG